MYGPEYEIILEKICQNKGISVKKTGEHCIALTYGRHTQYIWSRRFPQNPASSSRIIDSKCTCSALLISAGIPSVCHWELYRCDQEEYLLQETPSQTICENILATSGGVVIKPDNSYEGKDVYACFTSKQIEQALHDAFQRKAILAASPFIKSSAEYRVFYLNGECLLIYKKRLPEVTGDGVSTLEQLAYRHGISRKDISDCMDLHNIPSQGSKAVVSWKYNLSRGSTPEIVNDPILSESLWLLASKAAEVVNARFVTVDILENAETGMLSVLEINAGVAMDQFIIKHPNGREIAYSIYEKAIADLFLNCSFE